MTTTVRYMFAVLRSALRRAEKLALIDKDPSRAVVLPRRRRYVSRFLDQKAARRLSEACADHRLGPLFSTALAIGLRIGEAMGLKWADLDLAAGRLSVNRTCTDRRRASSLASPRASPVGAP
jgi:integrase